MAFQLKRSEEVGAGLRRIVREELTEALRVLGAARSAGGDNGDVGGDGGDRRGGRGRGSTRRRDEAVHEARKALKRTRAVMRLVRDALGGLAYRRDNFGLRDAARPLAAARDAKVLVETIEKLQHEKPDGARARGLAAMRTRAIENHHAVAVRVLVDEHAIEASSSAIAAVLARSQAWPLGAEGWSMCEAGFERVYRRGRRAWVAARAHATRARLHEWRKQVKYLVYALQLIEAAWTSHEKRLVRRAGRLADLLGEDHDLTVLRPLVSGRDLLRLIDRSRARLERRAFELGAKVYGAAPSEVVGHVRRAWKRWRRP